MNRILVSLVLSLLVSSAPAQQLIKDASLLGNTTLTGLLNLSPSGGTLNLGNVTISGIPASALTGTIADARLSGNVTLLGSSIDLGSEVTGSLPWGSITGTPTLGGAAALNVGTTTGTVASGDDAGLAFHRLRLAYGQTATLQRGQPYRLTLATAQSVMPSMSCSFHFSPADTQLVVTAASGETNPLVADMVPISPGPGNTLVIAHDYNFSDRFVVIEGLSASATIVSGGSPGTPLVPIYRAAWSRTALGLGTLATQNGTFSQVGLLSGNNTWTGNNTFLGNVSLSLAEEVTFQRVNLGNSSFGWRYNPTASPSPQVEIIFPGGTAAFYETGAPPAPYFYFAGTIQADQLVGNINATSINANALLGTIPGTVMDASLADMSRWMGGQNNAGLAGITYAENGTSFEPTPALSYYYPAVYIVDGGTENNTFEYRYRTRAQLLADLMPTATASLDWPSIAAGADASLTITVTGAATGSSQSVLLGWSAALPAGVVVKQAFVSGANTVTITLTNISASPVDPAAITCRASVAPY